MRKVGPRGYVSREPRWGSAEKPVAESDILVFGRLGEGDEETRDPRGMWMRLLCDFGGSQAGARGRRGPVPKGFGLEASWCEFPQTRREILKLGGGAPAAGGGACGPGTCMLSVSVVVPTGCTGAGCATRRGTLDSAAPDFPWQCRGRCPLWSVSGPATWPRRFLPLAWNGGPGRVGLRPTPAPRPR